MRHTLTIVGIGPGDQRFLTMEAIEAMEKANLVYFRTHKHPVVEKLHAMGIVSESFDATYDTSENFDVVYEQIADTLIKKLDDDDVTYAVPGNPFVAERTVELLQEKVEATAHGVEFIYGTSFIDAILSTLHKDPVHGLKVIDALQLDSQRPDPDTDVIVIQVYNSMVASNTKLKLMDYYDDEHEVLVVRGAGIKGEEIIRPIPLYELDRQDILDHLTSVYIPKVENKSGKYAFSDLVTIMDKLRSENGCPWDRKQTHMSLKPYLIEEAYEVLEAIDTEDFYLLEEELGDLLLQVVFHAQIANENGFFSIQDVMVQICEKLIRRHPHVFADVAVDTADEVLVNWEAIKREEKEETTHYASMGRIPKEMPALMRSYKVQGKAADVGFDWDDVTGALDKVSEEWAELMEIIDSGQRDLIEEEIGDLIFAVVNVARFMKIRPELALQKTIDKFLRRFQYIEETLAGKGKKMENSTLEEMDFYWNEAKNIEK